MNSTTYVFGGISGNSEEILFQFPDDYTSSVFRRFVGVSSNETVLAVSFDNSLAYHIYCIHTVNGYFGFGVLLNGNWIKGQQKLLSVLNDAYVDAISSGEILSINDTGAVQCNAYAIKQNVQEATRITERLRSIINTLSPYTESLPIIDISTDPDFIHKLPNNATENDWAKSIGKYRSHYSIYGDIKGSFSHILERLQYTIQEKERYGAQMRAYEKTISNLESQVKKLKQKTGISKSVYISTIVLAVIAIPIVCFVVRPSYTEETPIDTTMSTSNMVIHQAFLNPDGTGYYWTGELINGQPDGDGTIDYAEKDHDKRKRYIGVVKNGQRQADNATLTYRNGNKYVGSFDKDNFGNGTLSLKNDGMYFKGDFRNNKPYNGDWYFNDGTRYSYLENGIEFGEWNRKWNKNGI